MEKNTKKTSANSSILASQTTPDNSSTTNKNKSNKDEKKQEEITVAGTPAPSNQHALAHCLGGLGKITFGNG